MNACSGNEPFALQVLGDSMTPEFPDGVVVIVEPTGAVELKDATYVIAQHDDEFILRQLRIDGAKLRLEALNDDYAGIEIPNLGVIKGRVISRCGRRRSERKNYL